MSNRFSDPNEVSYTLMEVHGATMLFCDERLDRDLIPSGYYAYDIRSDDEGRQPAELNLKIWVNYFGTLISNRPFASVMTMDGFHIWLDECGGMWTYIPVTSGQTIMNASGLECSLEDYMKAYPPSGEEIRIKESERPEWISNEILRLNRQLCESR